MIISKSRGIKKTVTSSYFDDVTMLRKSRSESELGKLRKEGNFNVPALQQAYLIQEIKLWKMGCNELNTWVSQRSEAELKNVTTKYMGDDVTN